MKISIITVVYNNKQTIEQAINSVLAQSYANVEYIVIDGASSDGTLDIVRRYESKISKIISEPDNGIYDAMNKGIRIATGDIVGILNSDDLYADSSVLEDVVKSFQADSTLDILFGDLVYVRADNIDKIVRKWTSCAYYDRYFEDGNVPPHPALFLRSKVYEISGIFDLRFKLAADYEFMLRIFKKHSFKVEYLRRLMVKMRLGGATNQSFKNIFNGNREILKAWGANGLKAPYSLMPVRVLKRFSQFFNHEDSLNRS